MKKAVLPFLFCMLSLGAMAQPCLPDPDCNQAPILCGYDFNNLAHNTILGSPIISIPATFSNDCTNAVVDNNQFVGFVPCSSVAEIEVKTLGCTLGQGLQAIVYSTQDCINFYPVSNCAFQIFPGTAGTVTATGLIPGDVYYLMIDGFNGDECDYFVDVLSGIDTTQASPLQGSPGYIVASSQVLCTGTTFTFTLVPPTCSSAGSVCSTPFPMQDCATLNWNFPQGTNILNQNGLTVEVEFTQPTTGAVNVGFSMTNPNCQCFTNCGGCQTTINPLDITVGQPTTTTLPPITRCVGDVVFYCGQMYSVPIGGLHLSCQSSCGTELQEVIAQQCPANCLQYNQPVPPGNTCATAAPFCPNYLNGYCSNNSAYTASTPGNLTAAFGCSIENNQWISFVPCEDSVAFILSVSNCGTAQGMEFAVFSSSNCLNFTALAGCTTVAPGGLGLLQVPNLQPGNTYYLMVDGVNGDACNWEVNGLYGLSGGEVLQENITPGGIDGICDICLDDPSTPSDPIAYTATGPDCNILPANPNNNNCLPSQSFCPPAPQKFSEPFIDTILEATAWDTIWHIIPNWGGHFLNNDSIGTTVEIVWDTVGAFQIGADIVPNAWDTIIYLNDGIDNCATICPDGDPCVILPKVVNVGAPDKYFETYYICNGDCVNVHNQSFCFAGQFQITEQDATGCIDTIIININELPVPFVLINGPSLVCFGESAVLTAEAFGTAGPFIYFWSNGQNTQTITATSPGSYSVTVASIQGCTSVGNYSLNWVPPISTNLGPLSLCQDEVPYNFYGTTVTSSGNYSVNLVSWQGCDSTISQNITVLPPVSVTITSSVGTTLPPGVTAILDAGSGFANYLWQDGSSNQTFSTDQPGTYSVTVTTSAGCTGSASITLMAGTNPIACPNANFPIAPADSCAAAPPFCASYLNGFCSSNMGYSPSVPGNLGSVIPCSIENNQWLKFTTCDSSVQLVISVGNCMAAQGLQFVVLQTADCQIFTSPAACHNIAANGSDTLTFDGLAIGGTYYLMVDGISGDICQWEVQSTSGVSNGSVYQEDNTPGQVTGPTAVCAGGTANYTFTAPICDLIPVGGCPPAFQQSCLPQLDTCVILQYDTIWHVTPAGTIFVNNDSMGLTVTVEFPDTLPILPGGSMSFEISVELVPLPVDTLLCLNDCVAECLDILTDTIACGILPLNVTVCMPANTSEQQEACPGECVDFYGETFCLPGTYVVSTADQCGCVSEHTLIFDWIQELPPTISNLAETCDPTGSEYTVSFDVEGYGNPVFVNGQPLPGPNFTSSAIPSGQSYSFLVESIGFCGNYAVTADGAFTCPPCIGGTFDLGVMSLCPGETFPLLGNNYGAPGSYNETLLNPATNCLETYNFIIQQTVENQLVAGPVTELCDASNLYYTVGFDIASGNPPYLVNGNPVTGNFYQSGLIPSGQFYAFTITDAATCNPQQLDLSGSFTCACLNSPGTASLATINVCEGAMADVDFNNNAVLGPGDIQVFILHTSPSNTLGTVIGTNTTGSFGYVPGLMNFGQTYFISPAVGPDQGGTVDVSSACFSLAPGQPVVFYEKPVVDILAPGMLNCTMNSIMLNSMASGGSGNFSYDWAGPNNFTATVANPMVSEPGAYLLTLTDNLTACQDQSATAVLSDDAPPVFTVTNSEVNCQEPTAILVAASQMPGVTYTWTFPTGDVMTGDTISTNIPGDYTVTAEGLNGCTADATTFVTDNGVPPSISATSDTVNCSNPIAELTATSNEPLASFTWTLPDTSTSSGPTLVTDLVGAYSVVVTSPNGCSAEALTEVVKGPDPTLNTDVEVEDPTCFGYSDGSITVLGTNGGLEPYEYVLNDTIIGDSFPDLFSGDYVLTTTDANGCTGLDTIQVVDPPEVTVQIGDDQFVDLGQSVTLTMQSSITPDSIIWSGPNGELWPDVNTLSVSPMESGRYTIIISDVSLCRSSDTTYIYVNGQGKVFIPNVFSPNGDGKNDVIMVFGGGDVTQILDFQIFDRWGEMVFQDQNFLPNDPAHGWDGRQKGRLMDPAVFVVKAMVLFHDGTKKMVTGNVLLLR